MTMRSIVILYEDMYYEKLHGFIKKLRQDKGLSGLILEPQSARGTGNFINEVPKLLEMPLK